MRETFKVLCVVAFMFATPAAALAWTDNRPTVTVLVLRYACPPISILAIAGFLKLHFRADDVPDFLWRHVGTYFNRGGFCFGVRPVAVEGMCYFEVYFQNQHEERCLGHVAHFTGTWIFSRPCQDGRHRRGNRLWPRRIRRRPNCRARTGEVARQKPVL